MFKEMWCVLWIIIDCYSRNDMSEGEWGETKARKMRWTGRELKEERGSGEGEEEIIGGKRRRDKSEEERWRDEGEEKKQVYRAV